MRGSRSKALPDRALVNCQYSMATFSTGERRRRPHGDRQAGELALLLRQTFEAAILTSLYPRSQIDIYVQVPGRGGQGTLGGPGRGVPVSPHWPPPPSHSHPPRSYKPTEGTTAPASTRRRWR